MSWPSRLMISSRGRMPAPEAGPERAGHKRRRGGINSDRLKPGTRRQAAGQQQPEGSGDKDVTGTGEELRRTAGGRRNDDERGRAVRAGRAKGQLGWEEGRRRCMSAQPRRALIDAPARQRPRTGKIWNALGGCPPFHYCHTTDRSAA